MSLLIKISLQYYSYVIPATSVNSTTAATNLITRFEIRFIRETDATADQRFIETESGRVSLFKLIQSCHFAVKRRF